MKDFLLLRLLDRCKKVFRLLGIDFADMRTILQVKFEMDQRRVPTVFADSTKKEDKKKNQFLLSLGMYALFGLILIPFLFGEEYLFQLSIVFSIYIFLVMSSLISDFSSVLLDVRDRSILATKPITEKTLAAVKVIHVASYLLQLSLAIIAIPLIVAITVRGVGFALLFLGSIVLLNLFIIVITTLLYLLILRFFNGEVLKDMINYVQIGLSIALIVGYQIVVRSFEFVDLNIEFQAAWWQIFLPPIWFAALFELIFNQVVNPYLISFTSLAILVPIVAMVFYARFMPTFEYYLQKLDSHERNTKERKKRWLIWISNLICSSKEERAFFHFASIIVKRERQFKLKVYPSIGLALVLPYLFLFSEMRNSTWGEIASSQWYLSMYFTILLIPTIVVMAEYSEGYKGAWMYESSPLKGLHLAVKGTLKALLVKLVLPLYVLVSLIFLWIFSIRIIPDLIVLFFSSMLYMAICQLIAVRMKRPFSKSFKVIQDSKGWQMLGLVLLGGVFFLGHYVSLQFSGGVYGYLLMIIVANWLAWRRI
ncbi:hypothetical protein [Halalkalibacter hemicellulosilyticus]|uniref:Conserved protein n=1 Tax=Halalkalibacter hemicellulosilyticusJCM 9152 TaxID=1236971 RepID=W4QHE9_9BACI|nr:hypothetical protein [Halalkalibacter hemicellulosilyticus]GAE31078.1 conserved protein [Halalkalibacter hemicellulosilyticusJCM 9152]